MFANILWAANLPEFEKSSWDVFRQIIVSQYNLATIGIIVIIAVAGASWLTSFYISRRELRLIRGFLKEEITAGIEEKYR
jgi:hypothetical protein